MSDIAATWNIALNCWCPSCDTFFNILDTPDFWYDNPTLDIPEHGTERTRDFDVECPECGHGFKVDFEY